MANKNKQRREKKKKRIKHPDIGRTKAMVKNPFSRKTKIAPKECLTCKEKYTNIKVFRIGMINHVCKCNYYLVENAIKRLKEKELK